MLCACTCASVKVRSSQSLCQLHGRSCRSTPKKLSGRRARPCDLASRSDIHEELTPAIPEFRTAQLRSYEQIKTDQERSRQIKTSHDKWTVWSVCVRCTRVDLRSGPFVPFACPSPLLGDTDSEWHRMAQNGTDIFGNFDRIQRLQILKPVTLKLTVLHHILLLLLENRVPD